MTLLATPVASRLGGTTFGGLGAAAIAAGSRGRATTILVGAFTASSVLSPASTFSVTVTSTFPVATATATFPAATAAAAFPAATTAAAAAGKHSMASVASVGPLLPVSRKSVVQLSYSLDYVIAADTVTRCKVPLFQHVFGHMSRHVVLL